MHRWVMKPKIGMLLGNNVTIFSLQKAIGPPMRI